MLLLFISFALAEDSPLKHPTLGNPVATIEAQSHGPDKPPPSDGYEFKGKGGGSVKAKVGFLLLLSSSIPALSSRKLETGSPEQIQKQNRSLYMAGIGVGLIIWERIQD